MKLVSARLSFTATTSSIFPRALDGESNRASMSTLPDDTIVDILSRLPVKTLLRFRCASKPWCALIDGPDFIKMHIKRSIEQNTNLSLILRDSYLYSVEFDTLNNAVELDHPLKTREYGTEVLGSCNGLLCLYNTEEDIGLWNPSTRKHHMLPIAPIQISRSVCICQFIIYGFGYDCVNDDYKLVRMVQFYGKDDDSFDSEVQVYSLKANSWRRIHDFPYYLRYKRAYGMLASGALHFVVTRRPESDPTNLIVAFDLGLEEYREVPQPEYSDKNFYMNVVVLGGCLCILCNYFGVRVDIWVMKEYGVKESWTKLFSVSQPEDICSFEYVRPLAYSMSGAEVLFEQDTKKIICYDLEKKSVRNVKIRGIPNSIEAHICLGSLVPLNGDSRIDRKKQQAGAKKNNKKKNKKSVGFSLSCSSHVRGDDFLSKGFKLVL